MKYSWSDVRQIILLAYFRRVIVRTGPGKINIRANINFFLINWNTGFGILIKKDIGLLIEQQEFYNAD